MSSLEIRAHAFRLHPNDDLYEGIREYVMKNEIQAGTIQTCVGSLNQIAIRLADETKFANRIENFEICSLVGTVSQSGLHLHISLSDHEDVGRTCHARLQDLYDWRNCASRVWNHDFQQRNGQ